jgi:4-amino-4-deoxy-L-arabinose transferase-like glycosyltransferase
MKSKRNIFAILAAVVLLLLMAVLAGGAALRESITVDELAHIGAGVTYVQKFDLRFNEEHPPLPKILAALPLVLSGVRTDYTHISWTASDNFFAAFLGQWVFGEYLLSRWNNPHTVLVWARAPMLLLTLILGYCIFVYARRLGGDWAGLLCLTVYVTMPAFLTFAAVVHTDIAVTLFILLTLWRFADLWEQPTSKNALLFALCLAGALLSKFTAGILFFVFPAFALSTRWLPLLGQPAAKRDVRAWRRLRWRFTLRGILWAAIFVYLFYFIFSLGQPTDSLYLLGHNPAIMVLRRLLLAPWLYLRGVFMVLFTSSRATFILGRNYPHGVWFYFPVLFLLKTPLGFLGLLLLALVQALHSRKQKPSPDSPGGAAIPAEFAFHWRSIWVGLLVFLAFCLLSRLDLSIRHFTVPLVLLILLLAPLPRALGRLRIHSPRLALLYQAATLLCVLSCLFVCIRAYPYFFPYVNSLSFGRPAYALVNDSNLDWNQSLPEVQRFAEQHGIDHLALDYYGLNDPTVFVAQAHLWNCQTPSAVDGGQWVVVSASMLMDGHNCIWLMQCPHEILAGGSMYAVHLPENIPAAGAPGGPPSPANQRQLGGGPLDMRPYFLEYTLHPEKIPQAVAEMQEQYKNARKSGSQKAAPPAN